MQFRASADQADWHLWRLARGAGSPKLRAAIRESVRRRGHVAAQARCKGPRLAAIKDAKAIERSTRGQGAWLPCVLVRQAAADAQAKGNGCLSRSPAGLSGVDQLA